MLPPGMLQQKQPSTVEERRLLGLFRALGDDAKRTLLAFADFLAQRAEDAVAPEGGAAGVPSQPIPEPRPANETVIAAIKRLRRSYPMLDSGTMLHETAALMAAHVLQGREAAAVIDELEALFAQRYAALGARSD
jgi:hypothetical protein